MLVYYDYTVLHRSQKNARPASHSHSNVNVIVSLCQTYRRSEIISKYRVGLGRVHVLVHTTHETAYNQTTMMAHSVPHITNDRDAAINVNTSSTKYSLQKSKKKQNKVKFKCSSFIWNKC